MVTPLTFVRDGRSYLLFRKNELGRLHTQFGLPSTDALVSILKNGYIR